MFRPFWGSDSLTKLTTFWGDRSRLRSRVTHHHFSQLCILCFRGIQFFQQIRAPEAEKGQAAVFDSPKHGCCRKHYPFSIGWFCQWHKWENGWLFTWLVVEPTYLKNTCQIGSFPQFSEWKLKKKKNNWNTHLVIEAEGPNRDSTVLRPLSRPEVHVLPAHTACHLDKLLGSGSLPQNNISPHKAKWVISNKTSRVTPDFYEIPDCKAAWIISCGAIWYCLLSILWYGPWSASDVVWMCIFTEHLRLLKAAVRWPVLTLKKMNMDLRWVLEKWPSRNDHLKNVLWNARVSYIIIYIYPLTFYYSKDPLKWILCLFTTSKCCVLLCVSLGFRWSFLHTFHALPQLQWHKLWQWAVPRQRFGGWSTR